MTRLLLALTLCAVALPSAALASGEGWYDDYDEAAKAAVKEGKDLLIDFSGSDWCGWCIKLDKEVFQHAAFMDAAKKDYILVVLDFPRGAEAKAKVPNPERNQELVKKWGIRGYPTVLLTTAEGQVYARTGYQAGGPENYVTHLKEIRKKGREGLKNALTAMKAVEGATGDAKITALTAVLDMMEKNSGEAFAKVLVPGVKAAFAADADGSKGLKTRAVGIMLDAGMVDDDLKAAVMADDPKNEKGLYEKLVAASMKGITAQDQIPAALDMLEAFFTTGEAKDKQNAVNFRASAAYWSMRFLKDDARAKKHATALKALNPQNPRIQGLIKQILGE